MVPCSFLTGGVFECDLTHRRSVAVLCMLCKIRCNSMHSRCELHATLWSHIGTLMLLPAAEHRSTAGLLIPCHYLCGTILVTPYSMVYDWQVSRAGPMANTFLLAKLLAPFLSPAVSPFSSFILWVVIVGLESSVRTDRVLIALSQPWIANLF